MKKSPKNRKHTLFPISLFVEHPSLNATLKLNTKIQANIPPIVIIIDDSSTSVTLPNFVVGWIDETDAIVDVLIGCHDDEDGLIFFI